MFQERYERSLEYYLNQKLVENISLKPPSTEKKVQLLDQIASEFSLRRDNRGFEERMASALVTDQKHQRSPEIIHAAQSRHSTPLAEESVKRPVKDEVIPKKDCVCEDLRMIGSLCLCCLLEKGLEALY